MSRRGAGDPGGRCGRLRAAVAAAALAALVAVAPAAAQQPAPAPPAASAGAQAGGPKLDAKAWILVDPRDGSVLASKAPDKRLSIASTTKLMTAYLALKKLKPNQMVTAAPYHPSASAEILLGLRPGERMRMRDLLHGLLLPSANDAAETLAAGTSGSVPAFVTAMNQAAQRLGLANTSYANPVGLDDPNNYSSARDLTTLAGILLRNRLFAQIVDTPSATLHSGDHPRTVTSRNTLLDQAPWIDGVKTGHTLDAGYVLVGSGTQDSTTLISAVLGTPSEAARDANTLKLLTYGFSLYHPSQEVDKGEQLADPKLDYRGDHLPLLAQRPLAVNVREGQRVETQVSAPDEISGAVEKGETLGRATVTVDGKPAASTPLVAAEAVDAATFMNKAVAIAQNPLLLIPLGGIVIVVGLLLTTRGRDPREPATTAPRAPRARKPRQQEPRQRTPEERRRMHEERMRRRRQRAEREGGSG
jgi:serine-type D-Ala-D-Ala carboxypeptidase (penicillin-binding protein 5/6)